MYALDQLGGVRIDRWRMLRLMAGIRFNQVRENRHQIHVLNLVASQGFFVSSITPKAPKAPSDTWHLHDPPPPILSRFASQNKSQMILHSV